MTGLEKIIQKIEADSKIECNNVISEANDEAREILEKAKIVSEQNKQEIIKAALSKSQTELELASSRAELERKKSILAVKINIVNKVIEDALSRLKNLPDEDYFITVKKLIHVYAQKGCGILHFSAGDLKRLPENFESDVNEMFKDNGISVKISSEPVNIDSGFILVYDDIEQNCSFDALLNSSIDEIKDELYSKIFSGDSV